MSFGLTTVCLAYASSQLLTHPHRLRGEWSKAGYDAGPSSCDLDCLLANGLIESESGLEKPPRFEGYWVSRVPRCEVGGCQRDHDNRWALGTAPYDPHAGVLVTSVHGRWRGAVERSGGVGRYQTWTP